MKTEKDIAKEINENLTDGGSAWYFAMSIIEGIDLMIKDAQGDRLTMLYAMKNAACFINGYSAQDK